MTSTDNEQIEKLLQRGVSQILPSADFLRDRLVSGEKLKIYLGIDPTGPSLHIGHAISLKKLAQFQKLGHSIILLMGDFTARIGDPDKLSTRKPLTSEEINENLKNYKEQASKIISFDGDNPAEIKFNSEWLGSMNFGDVLELASKITVQRMLERDMFQKRIEESKPIYVHEFLYPLMQGQDSVAMMVDGEVGGNDQLFNMLTGRDLLKEHGKEKFVITNKLLVDQSGKKMGKSEGNMITLDDSPEEMFGKIMSWTDGMIVGGFELCTDVAESRINEIDIAIKNGDNPMIFKKELARAVVTLYHGEPSALQAEEAFSSIFQKNEIPTDLPELTALKGTLLSDVLVMGGFAQSKSDFRRLVEGGGISDITKDESVSDIHYSLSETTDFRIGKKRFVRIIVQ